MFRRTNYLAYTSTYFTFRKPGDILTMTVGDDTYFYVQNIRGDVVALMDSSGNQVASYTYDTWGKPTISNSNNLPNPFLYQGSYATFYDEEFQMYGMGARHYNPTTMRFISRDLNHGTLTNTMSQNLYIYCYNNPLGFKDPSGFSPVTVSCGVAGGLIADTGMPYKKESTNPQPIANGVPEFNDEKMDVAYTTWLAAEGKTSTAENATEFQHLWNEAGVVANSMKKYGDKSLNDNDMEIAFWCVYWERKAGMGLSGSQLVEFANVIKAICYLESRCGTDKTAVDEGIMQVNDKGAEVKLWGWVNKDFTVLHPICQPIFEGVTQNRCFAEIYHTKTAPCLSK